MPPTAVITAADASMDFISNNLTYFSSPSFVIPEHYRERVKPFQTPHYINIASMCVGETYLSLKYKLQSKSVSMGKYM